MGETCLIRYSVRVPFPDEDKYCFVLDKAGKVHYYDDRNNAEEVARQFYEAVIMESKYYGF